MSDNKQIKEEELKKVAGGSNIVNASEKTDADYKKEEIERLQEILSGPDVSFKEAMELLKRITELMRELQGYEDQGPFIKNR